MNRRRFLGVLAACVFGTGLLASTAEAAPYGYGYRGGDWRRREAERRRAEWRRREYERRRREEWERRRRAEWRRREAARRYYGRRYY